MLFLEGGIIIIFNVFMGKLRWEKLSDWFRVIYLINGGFEV